MNNSPTTQPKTAPFVAIYANGTPPQPRKHALRPEKPSLLLGPFQPWTSCLTFRPDGLRHPSDLLGPIDDREPVHRTVGMSMGTWDPGRGPVTAVRRNPPMQPEAVAPAELVAGPARQSLESTPDTLRHGRYGRWKAYFAADKKGSAPMGSFGRTVRASVEEHLRKSCLIRGKNSLAPVTASHDGWDMRDTSVQTIALAVPAPAIDSRVQPIQPEKPRAAGIQPIRPEAAPRDPALPQSRQAAPGPSRGWLLHPIALSP